ncbi:MAG: limonene-1,2-epoxide hydrolase family protein [Sandaracinobacter sp.]
MEAPFAASWPRQWADSTGGPTRLDRHRLATGWVELPVTGVYEVHDGRITYWRDYFDLATIMAHWPGA